MPLFTVTIERTDRQEPDPVNIRAHSKEDAIAFIHEIYEGRISRVVKAIRARPAIRNTALSSLIAFALSSCSTYEITRQCFAENPPSVGEQIAPVFGAVGGLIANSASDRTDRIGACMDRKRAEAGK